MVRSPSKISNNQSPGKRVTIVEDTNESQSENNQNKVTVNGDISALMGDNVGDPKSPTLYTKSNNQSKKMTKGKAGRSLDHTGNNRGLSLANTHDTRQNNQNKTNPNFKPTTARVNNNIKGFVNSSAYNIRSLDNDSPARNTRNTLNNNMNSHQFTTPGGSNIQNLNRTLNAQPTNLQVGAGLQTYAKMGATSQSQIDNSNSGFIQLKKGAFMHN